jgi:polyisoprenoid-binding protein YceI
MRFFAGALSALMLPLCISAVLPDASHVVGYRIQPESGSDFSLDIDKTGIWKGKHHSVHFTRYQADLEYNTERPIDSKVRFIIDGRSMTCTDEWLEEKNRRKVIDWGENHMIEVDKYPEMVFVSHGAVEKSPNNYEVTGALTVHGTTKTEKLQIRVNPEPDGLFQFSGEAWVNMRDFGLEPPSALMGAIGTKEMMYVHFRLTAHPASLAR